MPKIRILVVDGYADAAESLTMLLQMEGHEVETACCSMKAMERARSPLSRVVLFDIGRPDLNGHELAKWLCRPVDRHGLIRIALTGLDLQES